MPLGSGSSFWPLQRRLHCAVNKGAYDTKLMNETIAETPQFVLSLWNNWIMRTGKDQTMFHFRFAIRIHVAHFLFVFFAQVHTCLLMLKRLGRFSGTESLCCNGWDEILGYDGIYFVFISFLCRLSTMCWSETYDIWFGYFIQWTWVDSL